MAAAATHISFHAPLEERNAPVRVLVVDSYPLARHGLRCMLASDPAFDLIAAVGSAGEALDVARAHRIDVAISELALPSCSIRLTKQLKLVQPRCRVLGLSATEAPTQIAAMLRAGADGFVSKAQPKEDVIVAIGSVLAAERYLPPSLAERISPLVTSDEATPLERLTNREREIYDLLVVGSHNGTIASRLFISPRTVETHRHNLMRKLRVSSIAELILLSLQLEART